MKTFVTPEMAQEYLSRNPENRSLNLARANELAHVMLAGNWNSENRQGIQIDENGNLIDGQHRLTAIVLASNMDEAFKGMNFYVYTDVPPDVRTVVDFNRVRSVGDVLHMEGHKHGTIAGAAAGLVLNWIDGERLGVMRGKTEKLVFVQNHLEILRYAEMAASTHGASRPAALTAVLYLATRSGDALLDHVDRFVAGVADGAELTLRDPRLALRTWTFNHRKASTVEAFSAAAQAWNGFVARLEVASLRVNSGEDGQIVVPPIIGAPERGSGLDSLERDVVLPRAVMAAIGEAREQWAKQSQARQRDEGERAAS